MLAALANPHRLRIIAALAAGGRNYVSRLAREIGISRPLLHLHLQKLEDAGLVTSQLELSATARPSTTSRSPTSPSSSRPPPSPRRPRD